MSVKNKRTVAEWSALEAEKRSRLQILLTDVNKLRSQKGRLLIQLGEGNNSVNKELTAIEKHQEDLKSEIEYIEALLIEIPKQRDFAQADEIEDRINSILNLEKTLETLMAGITSKANEYILEVDKYYEKLQDLFNLMGVGTSDVARSSEEDISKAVMIACFSNKRRPQAAAKNFSPKKVTPPQELIKKMQAHVDQLRGGDAMSPDICPKCYGRFRYASNLETHRSCGSCGNKEITAA